MRAKRTTGRKGSPRHEIEHSADAGRFSFHLNKHLILRNRTAFVTAGAIFSCAPAEQEFQAHRDALHDSRNLANRGDNSLMDHVGGLLDAVEGAAEEFVGANDLQSGTIDRIITVASMRSTCARSTLVEACRFSAMIWQLGTHFREAAPAPAPQPAVPWSSLRCAMASTRRRSRACRDTWPAEFPPARPLRPPSQ